MSQQEEVQNYLKRFPGREISSAELDRALGFHGGAAAQTVSRLMERYPRCGITRVRVGRYRYADPFPKRALAQQIEGDQKAITTPARTEDTPAEDAPQPTGALLTFTSRGVMAGALFQVAAFDRHSFPILEDEQGRRDHVLLTRELFEALVKEHADRSAVKALKAGLRALIVDER